MKLIFLGTGSAFTVGDHNYHSNMLLESSEGKRLLIDCGSDIRFSLHEQGLSYQDIHDVYISHLHADHVGGIEGLAFNTKFNSAHQKVRLHLSDTLVPSIWDNVLAGGLTLLTEGKMQLSSYFVVEAVPSKGKFTWENIDFYLIQTVHIKTKNELMPCYGLLFRLKEMTIFITTDAQLTPEITNIYSQADLIFQDCETAPTKSGVHAHYTDLIKLDPQTKKKMWLYHYQPGPLPDAQAEGFCGFVKKGQVFNFS